MDTDLVPLLRAVVGRIVPADADPGALDLGTDAFVRTMLAGDAVDLAPLIDAGLRAIGPAFIGLSPAEQDARLAAVADASWFRRLAELVADGFYADPTNGGNRGAASWRMVGYQPRLPDGPDGPPPHPRPAARTAPPVEEYDAIVIGAGAGGGVAACVLAEAGKRVLLLERGVERTYANSGHRDHLRNHRAAIYGHNTGPDLAENPRVAVGDDGVPHTISPIDPRYHNNASAVGSGTLVYGMQAWRYLPDDFRMAARYGVPAGSSLADWPLSYEDLAPWYERAEWEIGVAGEDSGNRHQGPRKRGYPMPPVPRYGQGETLQRGAAAFGISTFTPPLLLNTVPRQGRAACIECGSCVGFPCPSDAKNGTQNTAVPRALATGRCDLRTGAVAERIDTGANGRVTGVTYATRTGGAIVRHHVRAAAVVVAGGAIETARLLLLSRSSAHPEGIGNGSDLVGRNLQGHFYPGAFALFDHDLHDSRGPGVTIASCDFSHGNPGVIGGAMLADDFIMLPSILWRTATPSHLQRWGAEAKDFMRRNYRRVTSVRGPVQEIPNPASRVTLDPDVTDAWGLPVARLSGKVHDETLRTTHAIRGKAEAWLKAAGAVDIWAPPIVARLSAGQHQAGTCRMGNDPANSVTDSWGRVWGHDNLVICDSSLHPTNGGMNPVLTIMALSFRNADALARGM